MNHREHEPYVTVVVNAYPGAMVGDVIVLCSHDLCAWTENLGNCPPTAEVGLAGTRHRLDMGYWP